MTSYSLPAGNGSVHNLGIDFVLKLGETGSTSGAAVIEYETRQGEEPPDHTHPTEDEMFYVLDGSIEFHCGEERHRLQAGGFVFLPRGIEHGYAIMGSDAVRLLVITAPPREDDKGWAGFVADLQTC